MPLTSAGYSAPTLDEILSEIETDQRTAISNALDQSASSPLGQLNGIFSRQIRKVYEAAAALYAATNPNGATGTQLDQLAALTGTYRAAATFTRVAVVVNVDPGTYAAGALVARVASNPSALFSNVDAVTNGGGSAADVSATFQALEAGSVQAPANTLEISGPFSGWNAVTSNTEGVTGSPADTDGALRARRNAEIAAQGSTTVDAIRADILRLVPGVISASVLENDTDATVDGIPPHSFEAVVYGPAAPTADDNQALADQIFASKPVGIQAHGSTSVTVEDSQGNSHSVGLTRPTEVPAGLELTLQSTQSGLDALGLRTDIAALAQAALAVGSDLDWSEAVAWAFQAVPGTVRVTAVEVGPAAGPLTAYGTLSADARELITLDSTDIVLNITEGAP